MDTQDFRTTMILVADYAQGICGIMVAPPRPGR
jgi:hypothetical protein